VVECRTCSREVRIESRPGLPYFAPRSTQPSIPPGSVNENEYQLRLGRQRQVWLIPIADERVGVQVKLWNPLRTRVIPERFCGSDSLLRGAISRVRTHIYLYFLLMVARVQQHQQPVQHCTRTDSLGNAVDVPPRVWLLASSCADSHDRTRTGRGQPHPCTRILRRPAGVVSPHFLLTTASRRTSPHASSASISTPQSPEDLRRDSAPRLCLTSKAHAQFHAKHY